MISSLRDKLDTKLAKPAALWVNKTGGQEVVIFRQTLQIFDKDDNFLWMLKIFILFLYFGFRFQIDDYKSSKCRGICHPFSFFPLGHNTMH